MSKADSLSNFSRCFVNFYFLIGVFSSKWNAELVFVFAVFPFLFHV